MTQTQAVRRAVLIVALLNLAYFGIEFAVARWIGSVSLLADSIDFLEDASINLLIVVALGWSVVMRARAGHVMAIIILIPGLAALWTVIEKLTIPVVPEAVTLSITGFGALVINMICALILVRYRSHEGSLTKAAFLSARNDVFGNAAIIAAGVLTAATLSILPDLIVGIGILIMNADAAREVWGAAKGEAEAARSPKA